MILDFPTTKHPANPDMEELENQIIWLTQFRDDVLNKIPHTEIAGRIEAAVGVLRRQKERL